MWDLHLKSSGEILYRVGEEGQHTTTTNTCSLTAIFRILKGRSLAQTMEDSTKKDFLLRPHKAEWLKWTNGRFHKVDLLEFKEMRIPHTP